MQSKFTKREAEAKTAHKIRKLKREEANLRNEVDRVRVLRVSLITHRYFNTFC